MTPPTFDLTPFLGRDEGQHFDRKSMFEDQGNKNHMRDHHRLRGGAAEP